MHIKDFDEGAKYRDALLKHRIVTDAGMRFGTAELTRLGFYEAEMRELASIIATILHKADDPKFISTKDSKKIQIQIDSLIKQNNCEIDYKIN